MQVKQFTKEIYSFQGLQVVTYIPEQLAINQKFPRPPLGSINLLEQITEFRKPAYSPDYQFITKEIKGCESAARRRDAWGKVLNKGASVEPWGPGWWHMEAFWFHLELSSTPPFWLSHGASLQSHV